METKRFLNKNDSEVIKLHYKMMGYSPLEIKEKIGAMTPMELNSLRRRLY